MLKIKNAFKKIRDKVKSPRRDKIVKDIKTGFFKRTNALINEIHNDPKGYVRWTRTILFFLLMLSIPWNWWHLYEIAKVERMTAVISQMPKSCRPEEMSWVEGFWESTKDMLRFGSIDCVKWHAKMYVDPIWAVPPTKAVVVTLANFIFEPFNYVGKIFNQIFKDALDGVGLIVAIPTYICLMIFISTILLFVLLLLLLIIVVSFGYKINVGFFGFEPGKNGKQSTLTWSKPTDPKNLKQTVAEQEKVIKEQEKTIQELREIIQAFKTKTRDDHDISGSMPDNQNGQLRLREK